MGKAGKIALGILIAAAIPASSVAQGRRCLRVEAPSPVVLPDASTHEAGSLRICQERAFSPVSSLHTIYVDGTPLGMFRARALSNGQRSDSAPYVVFTRTDDERLILVGYGWAAGGTGGAYRLETVPVVRVRVQTARNDDGDRPSSPGADDESRLLLIAASD